MGKVKDALNWIMNVETSVKDKVEEMVDEVKADVETPVAEATSAVVETVAQPTVDTDAAIANLKAFLITAGYVIPVFDQLASAAKALATK